MLEVLIEEEKIEQRIKEIGKQIAAEYNGKEVILICLLKGAIYFATKLSQEIKNENVIMDFMKVSSYSGTESTGKIKLSLDISQNIENKDIIVIEDIVDTGLTLSYVCDYLKERNPKSVKICTLLDKKARRKKEVNVDYVGFEIDDLFVVGYGLDYDEKYRNLPYIANVI